MKKGSLTVVGTGIHLGQISVEAVSFIKDAEKVYHLVADEVTSGWIVEQNTSTESLYDCYQQGVDRLSSYYEMVARIANSVRAGIKACAVFYGHPGVFVFPAHMVVRQLRLEGYRAVMLPGVSAEDCMFADLGFDPASVGCLSYEATDFLVHRRVVDIRSHLIIWQIGAIGNMGFMESKNRRALRLLSSSLAASYGADHKALIYEASRFAVAEPIITATKISELSDREISGISTLYVPPARRSEPDIGMVTELGLEQALLESEQMRVAACAIEPATVA
jgi:uncharacterized protein YabN with tetrapyrrole methylase and pyrophosphatase domain